MKNYTKTSLFILCLGLFGAKSLQSQTYNSNDYLAVGDTVYLTKASSINANYDTTGVGISWDYTGLSGVSQTKEIGLASNQTGYSAPQFPFIYNTNNVNLAQTNGQTISIGSLSATEPYNYFKKNASFLNQSASAYKIVVNGTTIAVKNTYNSPDTLYKFPLNMGNADSCNSSYTTNIPGIYYRNSQIKRVNQVVGSGTVSTPYGIFTNSLKLESVITQRDSIAVGGTGFQSTTIVYKEIKWFDASKKYPVLIVRKELVNSNFVTSSVEYLDNKMFFQPLAVFAYYPVCPIFGDTIQFQNLSVNSETYVWDFGDPTSGVLNTSSLQNPKHVFANSGVFNVNLITFNGGLSDTVSIPVVINANLDAPTIAIQSTQSAVCEGEEITFTSNITNGGSLPVYQWLVNGIIQIGENDPSFTSSNLQQEDSISCIIISSSLCLTSLSDTSNVFELNVNPLPQVSISPIQNICDTLNSFTLSQGMPAGGIYFVNSIETSTLDPSNLPFGSNELTYVYSDANLCSGTISTTFIVEDCSSSASLMENSKEFQLYPNPTKGKFKVSVYENQTITLRDCFGKVLLETKNAQIDISNFPDGIYFLQIEDGLQKRIVKLNQYHL